MKKDLIISTSTELVRIAPERIVCITSDGNYSTLVQADNAARLLSYQLGQIEKMMSSQLGAEGNAFINGHITIGVANNSPLFEQATEEGGYFFRQSPLVKNGRLVENNPKGKSIRRGLCSIGDEIFVVESGTPESFHDFSQSLVDLGVNQAVYLVGSSAYGWALDEQGVRHELGEPYLYSGRFKIPKNTSYIVWRKKGE